MLSLGLIYKIKMLDLRPIQRIFFLGRKSRLNIFIGVLLNSIDTYSLQ